MLQLSGIPMVQLRAARWVTHRYHNTSSVTDMLKDLGWVTLEERRRQARLTMMHKILQHLVAISSHPLRYAIHSRSRLAHQASLCQLHTNNDGHKYSYFPRTIVDWNTLPAATSRPSKDVCATQHHHKPAFRCFYHALTNFILAPFIDELFNTRMRLAVNGLKAELHPLH